MLKDSSCSVRRSHRGGGIIGCVTVLGVGSSVVGAGPAGGMVVFSATKGRVFAVVLD